MEPIPHILAEAWAHAMPGREAVAQNELLRTLHGLSTMSGIVLPEIRQSPRWLPTRQRQS